ncbi:MAG: YhjD/YihY/BrkB family envelope integrity protein [Planctomycetota bacterium]|nr:YhjD/YihY/BrkB family envelope integrity protein [Planctomycetota bacterium]
MNDLAMRLGRRWQSRPVRFMIDLARFGGRRLYYDNAPEMAAALAYRTIFSLIPVLVLALVLFKAFLGEQGMKNVLADLMEYTGLNRIELRTNMDGSTAPMNPLGDNWFVGPALPSDTAGMPGPVNGGSGGEDGAHDEAQSGSPTRLADTVQQFVERTVERIQELNSGLIAVVGILVLIYAALSLIIQVEQAFNTICRAPSGRSLRTRLTSYTFLLVLGPVFLVGGFFFSRAGVEWLSGLTPGFAAPLNLMARFVITWALLIAAYWLMPNARLKFRSAAAGALLAAALWEGAKSLLAAFVAYLANPDTGGQTAVYGSLALLPIFLTWVYITWLIVLLGFEVTYAVETVASGRHLALEREDKLPIVDPAMAVVIMGALAEGFERGQAMTGEQLAKRCGLAEATTDRVIQQLIKRSFVHRVADAKDADENAYTLARPPESISAADILTAMHDLAGDAPAPANGQVSVLGLLRRSQLEALSTIKLTSLNGTRAAKPGEAG